jgi:hypothetical protein
MTEKDLQNEWAWSQVETYVDGDLQDASLERMRDALRHDSRLARAVEHASAVRSALRSARAAPMPAGLRFRLLGIPSGPPVRWLWAAVPAAAAAAALTGLLMLRSVEPPQPDPRIVALQEFETAMKYVRKSAAITGHGVTGSVGGGVRDALLASRNSLRDADKETGG